MSILGAVYYEKFSPAYTAEDWVKAERYEYCDGFCEKMAGSSTGILQRIATILTAVF